MFYKIIQKIKFNYKVSFGFGLNFFYKTKFFLSLFLISISKKIAPKINYSIKLILKNDKNIFSFYLSDISDLGAFTEIFINKEYEINLCKDPKVIFDLGSNSGLSVIYFKIKYPNSKIFAFEPNPFAFEKLKKNTSQFNDVFCYNLAISNINGLEKFYVCDVDSLSSSFFKRKSKGHYLDVKTRSVKNLIEEFSLDRIDLMKFDVEGAEFKIFNNDFPFDLFDSMIGEIHLDLTDINIDKQEFLNKFRRFYDVNVFNISSKRFILKTKK